MSEGATEHKFLADFQPLQFRGHTKGMAYLALAINASLNWIALFGVFFVIGLALRLGLGL